MDEDPAALTAIGVAGLTRLDGSGRGIRDLTGIEALVGLTVLVLKDNELSDLSPLSALTDLAFLDLQNNRIRDVSPLSGLGRLKGLLLDRNRIEDPRPLADLDSLKTLGLRQNPIDWQAFDAFRQTLEDRGVELDLPPPEAAPPDYGSILAAMAGSRIAILTREGTAQEVYVVDPDGGDPYRPVPCGPAGHGVVRLVSRRPVPLRGMARLVVP